MTTLSLKKRFLPVVAIGAALALSACSSNGLNAKNLNKLNNGFNQAQAFNQFGGFNQAQKVKLPATRYGGGYEVVPGNCCQPVVCCQPVPVQRPIIEVQNIVEVPAPKPAPIIEYVYEQPQPSYTPPAPVYTQPEPVYTPPAPVYVPEPAPAPQPVYTPAPPPVYAPEPTPAPLYQYESSPRCPDGQVPVYGGEGCTPVLPLRK